MSKALATWLAERSARLDQVRAAHGAILETGRRHRVMTQQLNYAYVVLLASEFQGFCRGLHTEATVYIVAATPAGLQEVMESRLTENRLLDRANANPSTLGSDFGRFEMELWGALRAHNPTMKGRQTQLENLNAWRNAIAHHDFTKSSRLNLRVAEVHRFRTACSAIARGIDAVVGAQLVKLVGSSPW